ncbi:MAG: hypothetical protein WAU32_17660 [Thermoanaerobaculia bacterium]
MNKSETTLPKSHGGRLQHLPMAFAATLLSLALAVPVMAQTYTSIDCPGSSVTDARGINDLGSVVGGCNDADGNGHGFLLRHGSFQMIDVPGAISTGANGINNLGDIVGSYSDTDGVRHFYLLRHGKFTTIDFPGVILINVRGIDDLGRVVGVYAAEDGGLNHGFLLDRGRFHSVDYPGAADTRAHGINDLKQIVGSWDESPEIPNHGFLLKGGVFTQLDYPGAVGGTDASKINVLGNIVGWWYDDPDPNIANAHGFLLTQQGYESIEPPGATYSLAEGINDLGRIVGFYVAEDGSFHGFLRTPRSHGHDDDDD